MLFEGGPNHEAGESLGLTFSTGAGFSGSQQPDGIGADFVERNCALIALQML